MHLHGSRIIFVEFTVAVVLLAVLPLTSILMALRTPSWPWWLVPWLVVCAGITLNYASMLLLAREIARAEGPRPELPGLPRVENYNWVLPLLIVTPIVLPLLAWRQRNH
jgi:hypothetical protein